MRLSFARHNVLLWKGAAGNSTKSASRRPCRVGHCVRRAFERHRSSDKTIVAQEYAVVYFGMGLG